MGIIKRVKVRFDDRFRKISSQYRRCWVHITSTMKSVADLQHDLCTKCVDDSELDGVYLTLDNFTLPPCEPIVVIRDGDVIEVRRKARGSKAAKRRTRIGDKHVPAITPNALEASTEIVPAKKTQSHLKAGVSLPVAQHLAPSCTASSSSSSSESDTSSSSSSDTSHLSESEDEEELIPQAVPSSNGKHVHFVTSDAVPKAHTTEGTPCSSKSPETDKPVQTVR